MKGERSLPQGTQFRTVSDLYAEPQRWEVVLDQGNDHPTWRRYTTVPADKFLQDSTYGSASLRMAPSMLLVLVVERNDDE